MAWIDISEGLHPKMIESLKPGEKRTFTFEKDGVKTNYRLIRLDKKRGKVWTEIVPLYTPEEFGAFYAARNKTKN